MLFLRIPGSPKGNFLIAERDDFMKNNILLYSMQKAVSEDEYLRLSDHTLPHISEFNRTIILEMDYIVYF